MIKRSIFLMVLFPLTSCSRMNESLQLGGGLGTVSGLAATYAGHSTAGGKASGGTLTLSAGIGMGVGLLTSYLVHRRVESDRANYETDHTEMHFGDLPPSPFIVPKTQKIGGKR